MAVTYLGSLTLADAIPGAAGSIARLTAALDALRSTVKAQLDVLATAKASIRIAAIAELEAQLKAALDVGASLSVTDPSAFISGILDGLVTVQANISAIVPTVALNAQIDANAEITAELKAKIAAIDAALEVLVAISVALQAALAASVVIAIDLSPGGICAYRIDAQVGHIGPELTAELSGGLPTGGGATMPTHALLLAAESPTAWASMRAVFRTD